MEIAMSEHPESESQIEELQAHIAALSLTVLDLMRILAEIAPQALEQNLRIARLYPQEAAAGRVPFRGTLADKVHRLRRDFYEHALGRSDEENHLPE